MSQVRILRAVAAAAVAVVCAVGGGSLAEERPAEESVIEQIRQRDFKGMSREEIFRDIEAGNAERSRQEAERAAREHDTRQTLLSIRKTIFDIHLRIERIRSGKPSCAAVAEADATLREDLAALRSFRDEAARKCADQSTDARDVAAFCRMRLDEAEAEMTTIEAQRADLRARCPGLGTAKEPAR